MDLASFKTQYPLKRKDRLHMVLQTLGPKTCLTMCLLVGHPVCLWTAGWKLLPFSPQSCSQLFQPSGCGGWHPASAFTARIHSWMKSNLKQLRGPFFVKEMLPAHDTRAGRGGCPSGTAVGRSCHGWFACPILCTLGEEELYPALFFSAHRKCSGCLWK